MARRRRRTSVPMMLYDMALASAETIARRSLLMATGRCTPAEYQRMLTEKFTAAQKTSLVLLSKRQTPEKLITPWHGPAKRNAKRLRRKR